MDIDAIKTGWHERLQHEQATTQASGFENQMKKLNRSRAAFNDPGRTMA